MKARRFCGLISALFAIMLCFSGCINKPLEGTMTLVIDGENPLVYIVDLTQIDPNRGVLSVLEYLKSTENLEFTASSGIYGTFLTGVGDIKQDTTNGKYIYIYTSVAGDFDVTIYATEMEYEGRRLVSTGLGILDMTLKDDCIIYITTIFYGD